MGSTPWLSLPSELLSRHCRLRPRTWAKREAVVPCSRVSVSVP